MKKSSTLARVLAIVMACAMLVSLGACGKSEKGDYTYNDYLTGGPDTWNPHEWETNTDSYIMTYTEMGLYDFILNETKDGYEIFPEMAAAFPVDVTSEYAGNATYGVPADETAGYAFKIELNKKAVWADGTKINADTYIYSMKEILNPVMKNYRASSYYAGTMTIANAEAYYKQNAPIYVDIVTADAVADKADNEMYFTLTQPCYFFGTNSGKAYYNAGYTSYFLDANGNDLYTKYSEQDYYPLTDEAKADLLTIAANFGDPRAEAYKEFCFYISGYSEAVDWSTVGLLKTGEYEITLVLARPITEFYLKYNLSSNWIVYEPLYEAGKTQVGTLTKTNYNTSLETSMAYGPYKLSEYQEDKQITLVKNDKWYGYSDGKHKGQFMTTKINTVIVAEHATALQMFLQGKLDNIGLDAADMDTYRNSDFILFTPESYTSKFSFNIDKAALAARQSAGVNKVILSYKDFRKGVSLAMDRAAFAAQCTATHKAGFGLLNYMYVYDPDTGALYRDSEIAQQLLCDVYGAASYDQLTGYDLEAAKVCFQAAYDAALAAGDIKKNDKVEIEFNVYKNDDAYVKIVNFVQAAVTAATAGTSLEGKITIKMVANEDYYDQMQEGLCDMIISTWGGSSMDPFGIMECYCTDMYFEYGWDYNSEKLTINVNGTDITKSFAEWDEALRNGEYAVADVNTKLAILAAMEKGILLTYNCPPIYYRTTASLESRKVVQASEDYVQLVAFGGIRFMTYNYNDTEWAEYCTANNNQLTY